MTRAQHKRFSRLRKQQVNNNDITVVEASATSVTFHIAWPGLYLTYNNEGDLMFSETEAERRQKKKELIGPGHINPVVSGEMGSELYLPENPYGQHQEEDDDVPF